MGAYDIKPSRIWIDQFNQQIALEFKGWETFRIPIDKITKERFDEIHYQEEKKKWKKVK